MSGTNFLWLEVTGKCQLACSHCYAGSSPSGTHGSMTAGDWQRVIDQAAELGVRTVQFIGGEPTLHPDLVDLINHALSRAMAVEVFTNLVHVPAELWAVLEQPGVSLATSYYSDDPAEHAEITGKPSQVRTRANIREATKRGIPLRAGVIAVQGGQRVSEAVADLMDLGVSRIGGDRLREIGRAGVAGQQPSATELCGGCGDGVAAVGPDGAFRPCVMARFGEPIGNVHDTDLRDLEQGLSAARESLVAAGMNRGPGPCGPDGQNCYPIHCHPRA